MCTIVGKFEKGRSDFKRKLPEAVCCRWLPWILLRCHGGDVVCVCTEFHSNMCYHWPVIMINSFTKKHCLRLFVVVYKHVCC